MKKKKDNGQAGGIIMIMILMISLGILISESTWRSDDYDMDKYVGPIMCQQAGRDFIKIEYIINQNRQINQMKPAEFIHIYCSAPKNATQQPKPIYAGFMFEIK